MRPRSSVAVAVVQELPYAAGVVLKRKKKSENIGSWAQTNPHEIEHLQEDRLGSRGLNLNKQLRKILCTLLH